MAWFVWLIAGVLLGALICYIGIIIYFAKGTWW
jgi:hypothetical protein